MAASWKWASCYGDVLTTWDWFAEALTQESHDHL